MHSNATSVAAYLADLPPERRAAIEKEMTPAQIAEAERLAAVEAQPGEAVEQRVVH